MWYRTLSRLLFLLPLLSLGGCEGDAGDSSNQAFPPTTVAVMEVVPQSIPVVREYTGRTMGSREVEIHARVTGIIEERLYVEGEKVEAGAQLFRIDPLPFEVKVAAAKAELARGRAQLARAEREHARLEPLAQAGAISRREIDNAQSDVDLAAAAVKEAEAMLRETRIQLGYTWVTAPISGITGLARKFEGALVTAVSDDLLTTLVQTDPMDVHFSVSENEWLAQQSDIASGKLIVPAQEQLEVHIVLADGTVLERIGRINYSAPRIDDTTSTYNLRARFPNADGLLKAGQFVRVKVSGAVHPDTVAIPQKAVLEGLQGKYVYVIGKGEGGATVAESRPVEVGEWLSSPEGEMWVVRAGLDAGEQVILDNFPKLQPGSPVAVVDAVEPPALATTP